MTELSENLEQATVANDPNRSAGKLVMVGGGPPQAGKDELNFAEFPLGLLSHRNDSGENTLVFKDTIFDKRLGQNITRSLTVTGADAWGLPNAGDIDVLTALIQISHQQDFESDTVFFTRYQLLRILGWDTSGKSYDRISLALKRWLGVSLYYENAWRDKSATKDEGEWKNENGFHVLESYSLDESDVKKKGEKEGQGTFEFAKSSFRWGKKVFKSLRAGNVKKLDVALLFSFNSAVTRQLYRFLDKRFYFSPVYTNDLKILAHEKLGVARSRGVTALKRILSQAAEELEAAGYLVPMTPEERFVKKSVGVWEVTFQRLVAMPQRALSAGALDTTTIEVSSRTPLEEALVGFGVHPDIAARLVSENDADFVKRKLDVAKALLLKNDRKVSANPPGFLVSSIKNKFADPPNVQDPKILEEQQAKKLKRMEEKRQRALKAEAEEGARAERIQKACDAYWAKLPDAFREQEMAQAIEKADKLQFDLIKRGGPLAEAARKSVLNAHALAMLTAG
jgi:hypothetical protein